MGEVAKICLRGEWIESIGTETFRAFDPVTGEEFGLQYPLSPKGELDQVLSSATEADLLVRNWPGHRFADLLENYADRIEQQAEKLALIAHQETALPVSPRLLTVELPRTINQLRIAARHARDESWRQVTIDQETGIAACYRSLGPVLIFGPNNFPFAYNGISGGDFAAAVAAGNPVIAKGHPSHPATTAMLAEFAVEAANSTGFPPGFLQMVYHMSPQDGLQMVKDPRIAAVAFTGSRPAGMKIKAAADETGKPVYAEMSSINPVFVLPGFLENGLATLAEEFSASCLMASGQFCTNPGLVILPPGEKSSAWIEEVKQRFASSVCGPLFSSIVRDQFLENVKRLQTAGAELLTGGHAEGSQGYRVASTLLKVSAAQFLASPEVFQQEAFGNSSLIVETSDIQQMLQIASSLEGQLTGTIYLSESTDDEKIYGQLEPVLRRKVGRLLNNKMPTGVAVSPAMNHGGPFPATGHPGFTAVGFPGSIHRFSMLQCYDHVPAHRLPEVLR